MISNEGPSAVDLAWYLYSSTWLMRLTTGCLVASLSSGLSFFSAPGWAGGLVAARRCRRRAPCP